MPQRYASSDETHAMVARVAPAILELLSDGLPRSRHDIVDALAARHAKDGDFHPAALTSSSVRLAGTTPATRGRS